MIRTFLQYVMIDIGLHLMFDNIERNLGFNQPKKSSIVLPDNLISGVRCDVCVVDGSKLPIGAKLTGDWVNMIFNGCDGDMFYFITDAGYWVDLHIDNIAQIIIDSDDDISVLTNSMYYMDDDDMGDFDYDDYE